MSWCFLQCQLRTALQICSDRSLATESIVHTLSSPTSQDPSAGHSVPCLREAGTSGLPSSANVLGSHSYATKLSLVALEMVDPPS